MSARNGRTVFWHDGSRGGSRSIVVLVPDAHLSVVVLSNRGDADPIALATQLVDRSLAGR